MEHIEGRAKSAQHENTLVELAWVLPADRATVWRWMIGESPRRGETCVTSFYIDRQNIQNRIAYSLAATERRFDRRPAISHRGSVVGVAAGVSKTDGRETCEGKCRTN